MINTGFEILLNFDSLDTEVICVFLGMTFLNNFVYIFICCNELLQWPILRILK